MTYERLAVRCAAGVYGDHKLPAVEVVHSGVHRNVQFAVYKHHPLRTLVVAFAGSNEAWDWARHALVRFETMGKCKIHRGWLADMQGVFPMLFQLVRENKQETVMFVGHSYGGALAQLAAWFMGFTTDRIHTFGCPRVGNRAFAKALDKRIPTHYRYVITGDIVTQVPFGIRYKHAGRLIRLPYKPIAHRVENYLESVV